MNQKCVCVCVCVWDPSNCGGLQFDGDSAEVRKENERKRPEREREQRGDGV